MLLDEQLEFVAFGYEAEDIYADKATDQEHGECRLFQNFTLQLSNPDLVGEISTRERTLVMMLRQVISVLLKFCKLEAVLLRGHDLCAEIK